MCDHFFGLHTRQYLQTPRALWRCDRCGRQSHAPIDCCTRPDFAPILRCGTVRAGVRWLGEVSSRALTSLGVLLQRRRHHLITVPNHAPLATDPLEVAAETVDDRQGMDRHADTETEVDTTHVSV